VRETTTTTTRDDPASTISTDDVDGASYLIAEGCRLVDVERLGNGFSRFVIAGDEVRELAQRYLRGGVVVDLERYLAARRLLLDRIGRVRRFA